MDDDTSICNCPGSHGNFTHGSFITAEDYAIIDASYAAQNSGQTKQLSTSGASKASQVPSGSPATSALAALQVAPPSVYAELLPVDDDNWIFAWSLPDGMSIKAIAVFEGDPAALSGAASDTSELTILPLAAAPVPEPGTLGLLGLSVGSLLLKRRSRK